MDPMDIRFSQDNIGEHFRDGTCIFATRDCILEGMNKREVDMIHVVQRGPHHITLDNRRLAVYKMVRKAGKCRLVKVKIMQRHEVDHELRRKSDSTVEGLSVKIRGTDMVIHADGSLTTGKHLTDGQLQQRADAGGHWSDEQLRIIGAAIKDFEAVVKGVLGGGARLLKAGSYMKGTDIAGESDVDVMVFGCGPISEASWTQLVDGIRNRGYTIKSINPRCIHVQAKAGCITIEFDVVAKQRQGFPPNAEPDNPFEENRLAARAVRNIKLDFQETGQFPGRSCFNVLKAVEHRYPTFVGQRTFLRYR